MRVLDVSMPLREGMAAFPGDPTFSTQRAKSIDRGDGYNVSQIGLGTHTGTHVDPPLHFVADAVGIDGVDPETLNGPCRLVRIPESAQSIEPNHLAKVPPGTRRLLFRTRNSTRWASDDRFFADYVGLAPETAIELLRRRVRLVGIDSLSIERDPTGTFPVHHTLLGSGVLILEGLCLGRAAAGRYDLRCLPLRILNGDGGPARALLVQS